MNKSDDNKKTFAEIAAQEGEEAAIQAGIDADPDTFELDAEWFRHASPAREVIPHIRASYSWIPANDRTNFKLFVDKMLVAEGQVSEKRDRFSVTSVLDGTTGSFRTMQDTKYWAVEHFDFSTALSTPQRSSNSRASYSWISPDDRTNFQLSVDETRVADGQVSEKRDLFSVVSRLNGTTRSFRTMQAAKNWGLEHFDLNHFSTTPARRSNLKASFSWLSSKDRINFRLFVVEMLVAEGQINVKRELFTLISSLDGTQRSFRTMVAAKKWVIEHFVSIQLPAAPRQPVRLLAEDGSGYTAATDGPGRGPTHPPLESNSP